MKAQKKCDNNSKHPLSNQASIIYISDYFRTKGAESRQAFKVKSEKTEYKNKLEKQCHEKVLKYVSGLSNCQILE